jgi:hypothetical protein
VVCAVLYISCVVLQEKHGLRVCESRVQREVFGSEENGVTVDW